MGMPHRTRRNPPRRSGGGPLDPRRFWALVPPGTRMLLALITGATVLAALLPARAVGWVVLLPDTLSALRLSALVSSGFVAAPAHFISLIILLALVAFSLGPNLRRIWQTRPREVLLFVGGVVAVAILADLLLGSGQGVGLMVSLGLIGTFGLSAEQVWAPKKLVIFAVVIVVISDGVGAVLSAIWPGGYAGLLSGQGHSLVSVDALLHGLVAVYGLIHAKRKLYPLPFTGRAIIWAVVALDVFDVLFVGATRGLMSLTGVGLAVLLVTGEWRPERIVARVRLLKRRKQPRPKFDLIDGGRDDRTLH